MRWEDIGKVRGLPIFPYIDERYAAERILEDTSYENNENLKTNIAQRIEISKMAGGLLGLLSFYGGLYSIKYFPDPNYQAFVFLLSFGSIPAGYLFGGKLGELYYSRKFSKYK